MLHTFPAPLEYDEGVKWVKLAAAGGDPLAVYYMGVAYANGFGVGMDEAMARSQFRNAHELGYKNFQEK